MQYSHTNSKIPPILKQSITWLETRGLDKEGIYRLSGNQKNILELKTQFEKGFVLVPDYDVDINVITGIVKMFLRELPDPLFNFPANERQENSRLFI